MSKKTFISGIYNYCDRWCERCAYTASCRVWHDEQRAHRRNQRNEKDGSDPRVVFEDVGRSLKKAMRLLQRWARKSNIDLNEIAQQAEPLDQYRARQQRIQDHVLAREGMDYFQECSALTKAARERLEAAGQDLRERAGFMDVEKDVPVLGAVREAIEILMRDPPQVAAKMHRAIHGLPGGIQTEDDGASANHDAINTAGLICRLLTRDRQALLVLYEWDASLQDQAIGLLARSEKMLRAVEKLFPGCKDIRWPGDLEEA